MGKVNFQLMTRIVGVLLISLFIYVICRAVSSYMHGYSWQEMDWNQNGITSVAELIYGSDIGKREIIINQKPCIEYYAYKDGLPVKTVCP